MKMSNINRKKSRFDLQNNVFYHLSVLFFTVRHKVIWGDAAALLFLSPPASLSVSGSRWNAVPLRPRT